MGFVQLWKWNNSSRLQLAFLGILLIFVGVIASKFTISLGSVCISVAGLCSPNFQSDWQKLKQRPSLWVLMGIMGLVVCSGFNSQDSGRWLTLVRVNLPYLLLPLAFGLLPKFSKQQLQKLLYCFIILLFISAIGVLLYYTVHFDHIILGLKRSKAIPTPQGDHIRYSLLLCIAILLIAKLWQEGFYWRYKWEAYFLLFMGFFFWIMLHILAVRSGLLAFYLVVGIWILQLIITQKRYLLGCILLVIMFSIPPLAYHFIPSFKTKVELMRYNWSEYQHGRIGDLSDTQRLLSYQIALQVGKQSPWVGVGLGDLKMEQQKIYKRNYPQQRVMYPHNQFLSFYAGTGVLGLLSFIFIFFQPLFYKQRYRNIYFLSYYVILLASFLTENTLFISVGVTIHLIFLLLFLEESTLIKVQKIEDS